MKDLSVKNVIKKNANKYEQTNRFKIKSFSRISIK